jgi:hypothetical protein
MKKHKLKILFGCAGLFLFTACGEYDKEKDLYYHKAMGEGYVFYEGTNEPAPFARVTVKASFYSNGGYLGGGDINEDYKADEKGYYKVKFIKRKNAIGKSAISIGSMVYAANPLFQSNTVRPIHLDKDFLKEQKKNFKLDTLRIDKEERF